jgi:hypothetical protein
MATLEVAYEWGVRVWEEDARDGIELKVDDDLEEDTLGNLRPSGLKCVCFGHVQISEAYEELPKSMPDWWAVISEAEGVTQVKLNGSVIWSLAQAAELGEIMAEVGEGEVNPMLADFDDDDEDE